MISVRPKGTAIIGVFIVLLLCASVASAENRAGAVTISPFVGRILFDHDLNYDNDLIFGLDAAYSLTKDFDAELSWFRTNTNMNNDAGIRRDASVDVYRLEGLYHLSSLFPNSHLVPFVAAGLGMMSFERAPSGSGRDNDLAADYGLGLKYFINPDVAFRADVRHLINFRGEGGNTYNQNLIYTAGLSLLLGGEKAAAPVVEEKAAEPAPVFAPKDSDGDGVPDSLDKCPDTPSGVRVDKDGCPLDSDGDGVFDYLDKCPDTPKGAKVDKDGCPLDSDGDGVPDYLDKCPDTPKGTKVDANGCPLPEKAVVTEQGTYSFGIVYFDTNKATIKPNSRPVLDNAVEYMEKNPGVKLEVQGHTDSVGADAYNMKLSEARAAAVKKYMTDKGIDADRLETKGFGESRPAASNATKEGRAKNRRIEFKPF